MSATAGQTILLLLSDYRKMLVDASCEGRIFVDCRANHIRIEARRNHGTMEDNPEAVMSGHQVMELRNQRMKIRKAMDGVVRRMKAPSDYLTLHVSADGISGLLRQGQKDEILFSDAGEAAAILDNLYEPQQEIPS